LRQINSAILKVPDAAWRDQAKEHGKKLLALESSARAEAFRLLLAAVERAGEEARLAAEVNGLK
jgi:hypothetical protein